MKCLVTGAAGFIGSTLSEALLDLGNEVQGLDCFTDYYDPALKRRNLAALTDRQGFTSVEADLCTVDIGPLLAGVETIFHEAAQAGVRTSWGVNFHHYTQNNILATQRLLEAAVKSGVKKVVYASSSSVYGDSEARPTSEDAPLKPISPYGVTKVAVEHLNYLYYKSHGFYTVGLRYFTAFGPRQRPDMAFHRFIRAALEGRPIEVFGDGLQSRDFTYVDDVVSATLAAAEHGRGGGVYNVGGGAVATVRETLKVLSEIMNSELEVNYLDGIKGDIRHTSADLSKAREDFDYRPRISLRQGLEAEVAWLERLAAEGFLSGKAK